MLRDRTGQLTARLGQDLMQMLQPLNWALSQLLQNILSLGGGLFMCQSTHHPSHRSPPRLILSHGWTAGGHRPVRVVEALHAGLHLHLPRTPSPLSLRPWLRPRADSSGYLWVVR